MNAIWRVGLFYAKSLLLQKITIPVSVVTVVLILGAALFIPVNLGRPYKLMLDLLFATQSSLLIAAALLYGFLLRSDEQSLGSFVLPLAARIKRGHYYMGVHLALFMAIGSLFLIFAVVDGIVFSLLSLNVGSLLSQLLFIAFEAVIVAAAFMALSQYVSLMNGMIYTLLLFFAGHGLDEFYLYIVSEYKQGAVLEITRFFYYGALNFSFFDYQGAVVNGVVLSFQTLVCTVLYATLWTLIIIRTGYYKFVSKVLVQHEA